MKTNPLQFRPEFTRRDALKGLTLGAGATLLSPFLAQLVAHAAGSPAATLEWRAGSRINAWPADTAPPTDGTSYRLAPPGERGGITVTFAVLAGPPAEFEALVPLLIEKGCTGQLDLLVAAVESAAQD